MGMDEIFTGLGAGYFAAGVVVLLSLIQISPLELNPWDKILGWLGRKINRETETRMAKVERQVQEMWIYNHRHSILTFARECRSGVTHSPDEWMNVLNVAEEYEKYVNENRVTNGIITQDTEFIRNLYQDLSREQKL